MSTALLEHKARRVKNLSSLFHKDIQKLVIPNNGLTHEGVEIIRSYLYREHEIMLPSHSHAMEENPHDSPEAWSWKWKVTGRGTYVGTLPKRISKWVHKGWGIKVRPEVLAQIGNIAADHCPKVLDCYLSFTNVLEWDRGEFGDDGSCFWTCHRQGRTMIQDAGGWAVRFWENQDGERSSSTGRLGHARAWLLPRMGDWFLFNGYAASCSSMTGNPTLRIAQAVSQHLGLSYTKVNLENNGLWDGLLYINGGIGYAIGTQEKIADFVVDDVDDDLVVIDFDLCEPESFNCYDCGTGLEEEDRVFHPDSDDTVWCRECYPCLDCEECAEHIHQSDAHTHDHRELCFDCYEDAVGEDVQEEEGSQAKADEQVAF